MSEVVDRLRAALSGSYRIEEEVGAGGMAVVFRALDLRHDRTVAIKVLRSELASELGPGRFEREIQIAAGLTHPHILGLFDSGQADGLLYYVMPFVEGESLRERLDREGRLEVSEARRILREVADALAFAHGRGVVHRDVKPANVMLTGRHALVTDFGVAKAFSDVTTRMTATGTAIGTPRYMAPEQAAGEADVDHRADIYALGVVGYEVLTGRTPFKGTSFEAVLAEKLSNHVPPIDAHAGGVPPALAAAVHRCLARDPNRRWQSADDIVTALEALETPANGTRSPRVRRGRRLKAGRAAVLLVAAGLVVALGLPFWRWLERRAEAESARTEGIPEVQRLAEAGDVSAAFALGLDLRQTLGADAELQRTLAAIAIQVPLSSEPAGATVYWRPYATGDDTWRELGRTPLDALIPNAYSDVRLVLEGYEPKLRSDYVFGFAGLTESLRLAPVGSVPDGMVPVDGGLIGLEAPGLESTPPLRLGDYFLDRTEVTNRAFREFVDAGGYESSDWWLEPFVDGGTELMWAEAMARFTDRTGLSGPATWEAGAPVAGADEQPVLGISWYEAMAYARFVGKQLPTIFHWNHALGAEGMNWVAPRSVYGAAGPRDVATSGAYGRFGNHDMGGNAREWVYNEAGGERYILGGGWDDALYLFNDVFAQSPWDRSLTNGVRLAIYTDSVGLAEARLPIVRPFRDFRALSPVSDEVFEAYRSFYAYDRTPLHAVVVAADTTRDWIRERVTYDAGYEGPQGVLYLFLPRSGSPPYQTVVLFPGSGPIFFDSVDRVPVIVFDFILRTGRALLLPVYWSTLDRRAGLTTDQPEETTEYRERVLRWSKDLRRSIDYVETRLELDAGALAYYGVSWGARMGPLMMALEPRFDAGVLYVAGLKFQESLPEADPFHFAPRVTAPTLMLSGRLDHFFPLETSARPLFDLLGPPDSLKRHVIEDGGHFVPRNVLVSETLAWLDRFLGPVR
jgi:hypothetical protein